MSGRKRLLPIIGFLVAAIVLVAIGTYTIHRSEVILREEVEQKSLLFVQAAVKDVNSWLDRKEVVVEAAYQYIERHPDSFDSLGDMLHALASVDSDNVTAAVWVGPRLVAAAGRMATQDDLTLRDLRVQLPLTLGRVAVSAPFVDPVSNRPAVAIYKMVNVSGESDPVLILFAERLSSLAVQLGQLQVSGNGYAFLTDSKSRSLIHPDGAVVFTDLSQHGDNGFAKLGGDLKQGRTGLTYYVGRGISKLAVYTKVPETGWMFGVVIPTDEAFAAVGTLRRNVAILIGALLLTLLVIVYTTGRGLKDTFRQISRGVTSSQIVNLNSNLDGLSPEEQLEQIALTLDRAVSNLEAFPEVLNRILGLKDAYTGEHSRKVTQLAVAIGERLGLGSRELRELACAAVLHDIGKVAVPDAILGKPGQLTESEFQVIQTHPVVGADVAREANISGPIVGAILHHHERFDGRGYPDGLAGESIPLYARIIAVADTYDAMNSHRPYRLASPASQVVSEMSQWAGSQFDPRVYEAFVTIVLTETEMRNPA